MSKQRKPESQTPNEKQTRAAGPGGQRRPARGSGLATRQQGDVAPEVRQEAKERIKHYAEVYLMRNGSRPLELTGEEQFRVWGLKPLALCRADDGRGLDVYVPQSQGRELTANEIMDVVERRVIACCERFVKSQEVVLEQAKGGPGGVPYLFLVEGLRRTLLKIEGQEVMPFEPTRHLARIVSDGHLFDPGRVRTSKGRRRQCHQNTARLYMNPRVRNAHIATGFAMSAHGQWYRHSWLVRDGEVVETTGPAAAYFGYLLSVEQAIEFLWAVDPEYLSQS